MNTGMFTISRHNAFELVKHSCDTEWGDSGYPVNLSPINISTILKFEIDNDMNLCITLASGDMEKLIALDDNGYLTLNS